MKNLVRALTLALACTGMAATTQVPSSFAKSLTGKVATVPVPCCPPDDPNACGLVNHK